MRREWVYPALCLMFLPAAALLLVSPPWSKSADIWETAAAIRAVAQDPSHPDNPLLALPGDTSPRFTPFTVFWGVVMRWMGADLWNIVTASGLLNYLLFVTGLGRIFRIRLGSSLGAAYALPVMLIVWGYGYAEANAYQAELFFYTLPYVGMFTYGVCFWGLSFLDEFLQRERVAALIGYVLLSVVALLSHPITALFLFAAAFALLLETRDWRRLVFLQAVPVAAFLSLWVWPYFDYPKLLLRGSSEAWYIPRLFQGQIPALGAALLGMPVLARFALKRRHLFWVYGCSLCLLLYLASWALGILIGSRFIFYGALFLHWGLAIYVLESGVFQRNFFAREPREIIVTAALVLAMFFPSAVQRTRELGWQLARPIGAALSSQSLPHPKDELEFLTPHLDESSVVMVDDTTGWPIPAVTGAKVVAQQKGDPLIQDEVNRRRDDANGFFAKDIAIEERIQLLQEYRATHVLVNWDSFSQNKGLFDQLGKIADLVARSGSLELYVLRGVRDEG